MTLQRDPFAATFGANPALLVGREKPIAGFKYALDNGPGSHERVSIITGQRGVGKTVLLNAFSDVAAERGWLVFEETATDGFLQRLKNRIIGHIVQQTQNLNKKTLTGLSLNFFSFGVSLQWQQGVQDFAAYGLREALEDLFRLLAQTPPLGAASGVLITVDELHYLKSDEMIQFGAIVQHLVREGQEVAVALAGIPSSVKPLLSDSDGSNPVTFLRRAHRIELERIAPQEVEKGLVQPLEAAGYSWAAGAKELAVDACRGYPFLIQLIGSAIFANARGNQVVTADVVESAAAVARLRLNTLVHEAALSDISPKDLEYLQAMAIDDGPSKTAVIAERLGKEAGYASTYRRRLVDQKLIVSTGQGEVAFAIPYLREYLRERAQNAAVYYD